MLRLLRTALAALALAALPAAAPAAEPDPAIQQVFVEGLQRLDAGDFSGAIRRFRSILTGDPSLHRVRLELARAYFLAEQWEAARREFFAVLSADIPEPVRRNVLAFLSAIDARRGWNWGFDVALLAGRGLTRSWHGDTVTLDFGGQELDWQIDRPKDPDFGLAYGGYLELRESLSEGGAGGPKITAGLRAQLTAEDYEGRGFDDHRLSLVAPVTFSFPERSFTIGPIASYRWYAGDPFEAEAGLQAQLVDRSIESWALVASGSATLVEGLDDPARDATRLSVSAGAFRSLSGSAIAGARLGLVRNDAAEAHESYTEYRAELVASADLGFGLTGTLRPHLTLTDYDEKAPLFPEARHDREAGISAKLTKADVFLWGFNPYLALDIAWHESNIGLYRYTDHGVRLGLAKAF